MQPSRSTFSQQLLRWFDRHQRVLPWRLPRDASRSMVLDPYHVLVSEAMLQQTQVATVVPYFQRFVARFPTIISLADANEQEVLRHWQGLGYYSRARNLRAAAKQIVAEFGGKIPQTVEELLTLPGVGRYTAGAISSIAFGRPAPILDGNVARVLCRLDCVRDDPRDPATRKVLWIRAEEILPKRRLGDFNSALMELGALVCTPKSPQCSACPVSQHCRAFAAGLQQQIPLAKKTKPTPLLRRTTFCIANGNRFLIEQRPAKGRWAGMWQFITVGSNGATNRSEIRQSLFSLQTSVPKQIGVVKHALTHRRYEFHVYACALKSKRDIKASDPSRRWVTLEQLEKFPLSRPQMKIAAMLRD